MIVVSDTSPILNLARINRLGILSSHYHRVLIPHAVNQELIPSGFDSFRSAPAPWLIVATPKDQDRVRALREDLDPGEAEAIVLAMELHADLVLVDERRGRRIAASLGLQITGLLGVLADAKQAGLIDRIKPVLDELTRDARFWIGANLYARVLVEFGET